MVLTLILCASALTLILIKWLLEESNQDKNKIMARSSAESIISDESTDPSNHVVKV